MAYFLFLERLLRSLRQNPGYVPLLLFGGFAFVLLVAVVVVVFRKYFTFVFKSLTRNKLRTGLTGFAVVILVIVVSLVWTILVFIDVAMQEKAREFKAIVTEKWQVPSRMPFSY